MEKLKGKKIAVVGFGIEGKDVIKFLLKGDAKVTLYDQKPFHELDFTDIDKNKINLVCGPDYLGNGFEGFDFIFRSPGIRPDIPEFISAKKNGSVITSAMKLFFELCPAKIIGVTGTKGKGTTSTLIYEILKEDGKKVCLAGNIGKPCLELLPMLDKDNLVILELSSFQLFDLERSPHVSVVLNITVDHLDWHKDRAEYVDAKKNIITHQNKDDFAVINADYETPKSFAKLTKGNVYFFSRNKEISGCYVKSGEIILNTDKNEIIGKTNNLQLRGEHNWENVTAAIIASNLVGARVSSIRKAVFGFKGLEHRLEFVRNHKGISFYNDSFSTNPQPTIAAIRSFKEPITLILGGSDKGLDYDEMGEEIVRNGNVQNIILIGQIAPIIKQSLVKANFDGRIFDLGMSSMQNIIEVAFENSKKDSVVLLSPASASFGMFKDYKERGNRFKDAIRSLNE